MARRVPLTSYKQYGTSTKDCCIFSAVMEHPRGTIIVGARSNFGAGTTAFDATATSFSRRKSRMPLSLRERLINLLQSQRLVELKFNHMTEQYGATLLPQILARQSSPAVGWAPIYASAKHPDWTSKKLIAGTHYCQFLNVLWLSCRNAHHAKRSTSKVAAGSRNDVL